MVFQKMFTAAKHVGRKYPPLVLGRWRPTTEDNVFRKVDLSNQDHCGPCSTVSVQRAPTHASRLYAWPTSYGHFL